MKELSIEEKAQRYNEALERAKGVIEQNPLMEYLKKGIEYIFPELKESEDERIRKELIAEVKEQIDCIPAPDCRDKEDEKALKQLNKWLAWLEKQGEQKTVDKIAKEVSKDKTSAIVFLKSTGIINEKGELADEYKIEQDEQKSSWSEEDEAIWAEISDLLREGYKQSGSKFSWDDIRNWVNTKLLKGRVQPQKQEWSEEDEVKINRIVACLENLNVADNDILLKDVDWLKSLRPQNNITDEELAQAKKDAYNDALDKIEYHSGEPTFDDGWGAAIWYLKKRNAQPQNTWKPSEEQIRALNYVVNLMASSERPTENDLYYNILKSLRQQLKKLMEK